LQQLDSDSNSSYYSNYTELSLAVNGLVLGKVSNIRRIKPCPLLDKHRTGLATGCGTHRAIEPFSHRDYAILVRVSSIKEFAAKKGLLILNGELDCSHQPGFTGLIGKAIHHHWHMTPITSTTSSNLIIRIVNFYHYCKEYSIIVGMLLYRYRSCFFCEMTDLFVTGTLVNAEY
jgi:hypothetical protein